MRHGERVDEIDVRSCELLEWKDEVLVLLAVDGGLELPPHEVGGESLLLGQADAIELLQVGQATPGKLHAPMTPFARLRRDLRLEGILLGPREVPGGGRLVGVHPDPIVGEGAEKVVDPAFLRGDVLQGDEGHGQDDPCDNVPVWGLDDHRHCLRA